MIQLITDPVGLRRWTSDTQRGLKGLNVNICRWSRALFCTNYLIRKVCNTERMGQK